MTFYNGYGNEIAMPAGGGVWTRRVIANPNLADPAKFTIGLLGANGVVNTAQGGCNTSDFIPVTPGKILSCGFIHKYRHNPWFEATVWCAYCTRYVFFGGDKTTVVAENKIDLAEGSMTGVVVPNGAVYVRASWNQYGGSYYFYPAKSPEKCFVHLADSPTTAPMYWYEGNAERSYIPSESVGYTRPAPYLGKTWALFGDSLTDAYGGKGWDASTQSTGGVGWTKDNTYVGWTGQLWASRIASELGLSIDNRAKSGSNINDGANGNYTGVSGIKMLDAYIAEVESGAAQCADYITVGFGSNTRTDQIGTISDDAAVVTSVYGAMKYFIERLRYLQKNYNQSMVFGFVLPPQSSWGQGNTRITEGRAAMLAVLNTDQYAVPYCDLWTQSGICLDQMTDGIHVASIESNNLYFHAMRRFLMGL